MQEILNDAIKNKSVSKLSKGGDKSSGDLTGKYIRNIINNMCSNDDVRYLEIGLYRGGTFSAALTGNSIRAVGIDNWSQNWKSGNPKEIFFSRINDIQGLNDFSIITADCWSSGLLDEKFNVYLFDGPHGWQDQYDALDKYLQYMDDEFIYIVDDYDEVNSPDVVNAVQQSIIDLDLEKTSEHYFGRGHGFHEGVYFCALKRKNS